MIFNKLYELSNQKTSRLVW